MKYALIAVVVLMSWGQPAVAQTWTVIGGGNISCGKWTKESRQGGPVHWQDKQWVLGFVSAARFYGSNFAKNTDADAMVGWIDD